MLRGTSTDALALARSLTTEVAVVAENRWEGAPGGGRRVIHEPRHGVRVCGQDESETAAALLHDFNTEFDAPTPGVPDLTERLRRLAGRSDVEILLAGVPAVGIAVTTYRPSIWDDGPVALLEELYVRPDLRGRGVGAALLIATVNAARGRGVRYFEINVDEGDVDAQRFYRAHGFTDVESPETGGRAFYFHRDLSR